ncbi:FAD dependent oxidoreductase [Aspergillus oryzae]|uniref:D-amino-acid oxidase n=1 Tax=Aspergillus oryzae TaxID=5062 RepID=A0A1S9DR69_ASPOZ|nr:FAD dependent oxidoreductase [Aspergillus oryzae]
MEQKNVVVIGAGVAGLTTALLLSRLPRYKVVVAAKHMPGDYDIEYASPWAGANYMPMSTRGTKAADWDKDTWAALEDLARNHPDAGIHFQECEIHSRSKDVGTTTAKWFGELLSPSPWFKDVVPNVSNTFTLHISLHQYRGIPSLARFPVPQKWSCIQTSCFQPYLDATSPSVHPDQKVDLVINCAGLMASKLGGVEDKTVVPARGQIVIVRNEAGKMLDVSGTDDGDGEACYVMTRAAGGGTILGGSYQLGNWDSQADPNLAVRIMKRAVKMCPQLTDGKEIEHLDIIRHSVGLRPVRANGARIEKERIGDTWVVHNYGAGGAGYQSSYGCAQAAVNLAEEALATRAKL